MDAIRIGPVSLGLYGKNYNQREEILSREISLESARAVYFLTRWQFNH